MKIKFILAALTVMAAVSCSNNMPSEERAGELIAAIPDHGMTEGYESCFTAEYYALLKEAWDIPSDFIEGIGSEEWLYYFLSGNGDTDGSEYPLIETISSEEITFTYLGQQHTLSLAEENGKWVTADFDGTKQKLSDYIATQRKFFKSNEWNERLAEFSPKNAEISRKDVEAYFSKYPE